MKQLSRRLWVVGMLIVILTVLVMSIYGQEEASASLQPDPDYLIALKYATIDTRQGEPDIPAALRSELSQTDEAGYYLVQYVAGSMFEWKNSVQQMGAELLTYVPNNTYVVRMTGAQRDNVTNLSTVQWIGVFQPAYRIAPGLLAEGQGVTTMNILTFPGVDIDETAKEIENLGGVVFSKSENEFRGKLRVNIDARYLEHVAVLQGIMWVEPWVEPILMNNEAREIMDVEDTVWNTQGLYGDGQIIAVADTGLDVGQNNTSMHDDFEERIVCAFALGRPGNSNGDDCWDGDWSDFQGHGTHVAGSALGNGASSGSDPDNHDYGSSFAGVAPEAQLVFQSTGDAEGGLDGIPDDLNNLFGRAYEEGARIHTNSWGAPVNGDYDDRSFDVDQFVWNNPDMVILFAAGNEGVDLSPSDGYVDGDSIDSPGTAKNIITVGATENNRPTFPETWGGSNFPLPPINGDLRANNISGMAAFSSRGPVDGDRIKPDIVAPGTFVLSARTHQLAIDMDAENGNEGWTAESPWVITDTVFHEGSHSWTTGTYGNNQNVSLTSSEVDIRVTNGANTLTFWTRHQLGSGDIGRVQYYRLIGDDWYDCTTVSGTVSTWQFMSCNFPYSDLASNDREHFRIRFLLESNDNDTGTGWFIDDIQLTSTGWGVYSPSESPDENYIYLGGTSMSTPLVAGTAALVREYYVDRNHNPSAALVKATLVNGAVNIAPGQYTSPQEIPNQAPNNVTGWGRVNVQESLFPAWPQSVTFWDVDNNNGIDHAELNTYEFEVVDASVPFRATLVWTDFPSDPFIGGPDANVIHNLDLVIGTPNGDTLYANGETDRTPNNNVEDIYLDASDVVTGTYTIWIEGNNIPEGPQGYALIVRGGRALNIFAPDENNPAYAGPHNLPSKIIVRVEKPTTGLTTSDFTASVNGHSANVITAYEGSDEYVLEILPPTQTNNGLYDLEVSVTDGAGTLRRTESNAVLYADSNNVDVSLVIDRSSSMVFTEPSSMTSYMEAAKQAATQFVDLMFDNDQLAVISFDHIIETPHPLALVDMASRTAAKQAISALDARGATSIGGGLEEGQNQLTSSGEAPHPWAIVLLTDGHENTSPMVADVLPAIAATKTIVHTVALGPSSDQDLLLDIAAQTGGTYNVAPTTSQLQGIYNTIAAAVSGQQTLLATTGSVQAGATDQKSVVVDSTIGEATFSISWANSASTIDLTLEDPNGNAINPAVAASNPDITYVSGSTYAYYRVKSSTLVYGVWKMMITGGTIPSAAQGINAPTAAENYSALVTGQVLGAAVTLNLYLDKLAYNVNEPIKVTATLSDDQPITGAEIIVIVGPIITAGPPSQAQAAANNPILILYDDGAHGDGAANDGVYANTLEGSNTANAGVYDFQVFTSGTDNDGEAFSRVVRQSVNVGLDENSFRSNLVEFAHTIYLPAALRP